MLKDIKIRKTFILILKVLLFVVVLVLLYKQLAKLSWIQFQTISLTKPYLILPILILFGVNWGAELMKWFAILKVNGIDINKKRMIYSFFSGIATGLVTPNRLGNFIGRMIFYKGKVRGHLVLGTLYSNFAQFLVTLLVGTLSATLLYGFIFEEFTRNYLYLTVFISLISTAFYFSVPYLGLNRVAYFRRKQNILQSFQLQAKSIMGRVFMLSLLRHAAFSFQYFMLLIAFGEAPTWNLLNGIFLFYLVSTIFPNLFVGKLVVRETLGLLIIGLFVDNSAVILTSSLILWLLNLGLPSLLGLVFILREKYFVNG